MEYSDLSSLNAPNLDYLTSCGDINAETWHIAVNFVIISLRAAKKKVANAKFALNVNQSRVKRCQLAMDARKIYLIYLVSDEAN